MKLGDVVQIVPTHKVVPGSLAILVELQENWVMGIIPVGTGKYIPVRLEPEDYVKIGEATWVPEWED